MRQDKILEILYPYIPAKALADYLGLTVSQIYNRTYRIGIKKDPKVKKAINRALMLNAGSGTRFQSGHMPHNKGKKMDAGLYTKCAPTMFKPGQRPHNTKGDNAISIRVDTSGKLYQYYKISDSQWVLYHRYLWEQANGPIPAKHIVRFIDGNTMNVELSNLECIPMSENAIRNTIHRFPDDLKKLIRLKAKLNKTIKNKQNGEK
ncbi:MAG: HNH endonuclease [Cytophagia bacterium]|nr:HNH endonuclease [Cytophagia bacterium]